MSVSRSYPLPANTMPWAIAVLLFLLPYGWSQPPLFPLAASDLRSTNLKPLLDAACPGKAYFHGAEAGCTVCPPGSDAVVTGNAGIQLTAVTYGHFVSAASDDALLSTSGCETQGANLGGTLLLTRTAGKWQRQH